VKALILAAGEGTRLGPLTQHRLRPVLEHLVRLLRHHGVVEIAINLHYRPEVIETPKRLPSPRCRTITSGR
jgi:NDP-sugar pyrophosphorylase family protein